MGGGSLYQDKVGRMKEPEVAGDWREIAFQTQQAGNARKLIAPMVEYTGLLKIKPGNIPTRIERVCASTLQVRICWQLMDSGKRNFSSLWGLYLFERTNNSFRVLQMCQWLIREIKTHSPLVLFNQEWDKITRLEFYFSPCLPLSMSVCCMSFNLLHPKCCLVPLPLSVCVHVPN